MAGASVPLINGLLLAGAEVSYHDPLIPSVRLGEGTMASTADPHGEDYDLVIIHTMHPGVNYGWADGCPRILDAAYYFAGPKCVL